MAADYSLILHELRKAKAAHIKWRSYAYAMLAGLEIDAEYTPVEHTACAFGKWYHGAGKEHFSCLDTYAGIAVPHRILHQLYNKTYEMIQQGKFEEAEVDARLLTELSRQVIEALELVEREIESIR
jgi:Chemoreceptor zinc-binding domain